MSEFDNEEIEKLADRSPGAEHEDPYADVDISTLPDWWQKGIEEHRAYGLRPYRPPRFADDELYPPLKKELESTHGIDLSLICYDIEENVWDVRVDGEKIGGIKRRRSPAGFSVIGIDHDEFRELVAEAV